MFDDELIRTTYIWELDAGAILAHSNDEALWSDILEDIFCHANESHIDHD